MTVRSLRNLTALSLLSLAPLTLAQQVETPATPEFPEVNLGLTPLYAATSPEKTAAEKKADLWNDRSENWHYISHLGFWFAQSSGTVGKGDFEVDADASFSDIFDKLNFGFGIDSELRKGPFSLIIFGMYQHFESDATGPLGNDGDVEAELAVVDLALAYEFWRTPLGDGGSSFALEGLAGLRWTYLSAGIDINEGPLAGRDQDRDKNWFDPYLGARARIDFDRHWNVSVLGTAGGFGVGSDFAWSSYAQLEYRFNEKWSAFVGYRAMSYDYEDDGFKFDVTLFGPVIGVALRH